MGVAEPTNIYVNTFGSAQVPMTDGKIAEIVRKIFPMRPYDIEHRLQLRKPIYSDTASYGHMGRVPEKKEVTFVDGSGKEKKVKIETFTWEKLDKVNEIKKAFNLK
jgi:S-adenosylmethionine synthetase